MDKSFWNAALLMIFAVLFLVLSATQKTWPEAVRIGLGLAGGILGILGGLIVIEAIRYNSANIASLRSINDAEVLRLEKQIELVMAVKQLPPDYVLMLLQIAPVLAGSLGPIPAFKTPQGPVTYQTIDEFFQRSTTESTAPVSSWSDSQGRDAAKRFLSWLQGMGLAGQARGPYPAPWSSAGAIDQAKSMVYGQRIKSTIGGEEN